jgi:hypothetical protein
MLRYDSCVVRVASDVLRLPQSTLGAVLSKIAFMLLNIDHPDADRLARELTAITGESVPDAVVQALRERLSREIQRHQIPRLRD